MSGRAQSGSTGAPQSRVIDMLPNSPADKSADTSIQPTTAPEPSEPQEPRQKSRPDAMSRMAQSLGSQSRRVQGIDQGPAPSIRGTVTDLDAYRRAQAAVTNKKFNPMIKAMVDKGVFDKTGTDDRLNEFAPGQGGGSGNYFQALASAWYNGAFDTGSLQKGIKSKEDVERLLNRGIVAPDGKIRKYAIDYNSDFDGVVISSDDYYEHADYNDQGQEVDSRTGQKWGPYDYMEFSDEDLSESLNELSTDKLAQYKTAAALDAGAADKRGDYERGDKRFAGIVKATKKQFANDLKKHDQQGAAESNLEEVDRRGFLRGMGAAAVAGAAGGAKAASVRNLNQEDLKTISEFMFVYAVLRYYPIQGSTRYMGDNLRPAIDKFLKDYGPEGKDLLNRVFKHAKQNFDSMSEIEQKNLADNLYKDYTKVNAIERKFWNLTDTFESVEVNVEQGVAEGSSTSSDAVERAILNRIMVAHTDLLMRFGPDKVMQAAEEVAYNVGDVDEIGTSDVSAYVNQVKQILGA